VNDPVHVFEVPARPYPGRALPVPPPAGELAATIDGAATAFGPGAVWHVNSTCDGGGVAELLHGFLRRHNQLGIPTRWLVADAGPDFFAMTKQLYFKIYGTDRAPEPLTPADRRLYAAVTAAHADRALRYLRPGDIAVLHDPQTLGMAPALAAAGVRVVWQCHLGSTIPNPWTDEVWAFFGEDLHVPEGYVFSDPRYVPAVLDSGQVVINPPAIDPVSPKNRPLDPAQVAAILDGIGLTPAGDLPPAAVSLGTDVGRPRPGWLPRMAAVEQAAPLPAGAPVVLQVSRWDTLKDMAGVLTAFTGHIAPGTDAHLVLAGPDPTAIADDPGGVAVLDGIRAAVAAQPGPVRRRIHLVVMAGDDLEGTAVVINALQRRATVITQKSIKEGFGLTITEGMRKSVPVVAPDVGAIGTQVIHGRTGLLVTDPLDLAAFGAAVLRLLTDPGLARRLAVGGYRHCAENFLIDRQLGDYAGLYTRLLRQPAAHG
jgi:trehalose synthase